jgi:predicted ATP-dependent Lon-type protease
LQQNTNLPSNLSYSQLNQQLQQTDTQIALQHPNDQLKQLFKRTQSNGQKHLDELKQQLSLLTQTLLDDEKFNASELKMIAELQANSRKEITLLKNKIKQFEKFTQNFENTLNTESV